MGGRAERRRHGKLRAISPRRRKGHAIATDHQPRPYADPGAGWVTFAMTVVMLIGVLNIIEGVVALTDSTFYAKDAVFVFSDLRTWGWIMLVLGVLQFTAGYVLYAGSQVARWFVAATCAINGIGQLMFVQAYPFWCLTLFAVDVLVIYAVSRYGSREAAANR